MVFRSQDDADFILDLLRAGDRPSRDEADELTYAPLLHHLRAKVEEKDLSWLLPLIALDDERGAFYISLLRQYAVRSDVQEMLRSSWSTSSPLVRSHLLWRLTDDPDLPLEWKERLAEFVFCEWHTFQSAALRFYGGKQDSALAGALDRYCGSEFALSKAWTYLCTIANASKFPCAVNMILTIGCTHQDEFTRTVAERLLRRVGQYPLDPTDSVN